MLLALVPFAAFALAFLIGVAAILIFLRKARTTVKDTPAGQSIQVTGPMGYLGIQHHNHLDPRLASMLAYPSEVRLNPVGPETDMDWSVGNLRGRCLSIECTTPDPLQSVWEYYRRELPTWKFICLDEPGYEMTESADGYQRKIRLRATGNHSCIERIVILR